MLLNQIVEMVQKDRGDGVTSCGHLSEEMVVKIFNAGAYHGLWNEEHFGLYDQRNTVNNFIATLVELNQSK